MLTLSIALHFQSERNDRGTWPAFFILNHISDWGSGNNSIFLETFDSSFIDYSSPATDLSPSPLKDAPYFLPDELWNGRGIPEAFPPLSKASFY